MKATELSVYGELMNIGIPTRYGPGIYLLSKSGEVVYVGQSVDPLIRLADHKRRKLDFDDVSLIRFHSYDLNLVETALIYSLKPRYNGRRSGGRMHIPMRAEQFVNARVPTRLPENMQILIGEMQLAVKADYLKAA